LDHPRWTDEDEPVTNIPAEPTHSPDVSATGHNLSDADVRHNMKTMVSRDGLFATGCAAISMVATPLWVFLGASSTFLGFTHSLMILSLVGLAMSPYISARFVYKRWYMFFAHVPYIAVWGAMGLFLILAQELEGSHKLVLVAMTILTGVNQFFGGFVTLPGQQFTSACLPMSHRGRHTAWAEGAGSAGSIGMTLLCGWILLETSAPQSFGIIYLLAWVFCQSGFVAALSAREERTPLKAEERPNIGKILTNLKKDRAYLRLLLLHTMFLALLNPIVQIFVAAYGFAALEMKHEMAAVLLFVAGIAKIVIAVPIGHLTDRFLPRQLLPFSPIVFVLALLPVLVMANQTGVIISTGLLAVFYVGHVAAIMPLIYGLPSREDRAGFYTVIHLLSIIGSSVGPLMIGVLCDLISFRATFLVIAIVAITLCPIAMLMLRGLADRPRDAHIHPTEPSPEPR
jgi:MFS family permease